MPARTLFAASWFGPALIALTAWNAILASLDPAGSYPRQREGPGLTVDEMFNVEQGGFLVEAVRQYGLAALDIRSIREIFGQDVYLADHPPLGRVWLGVFHHLTWAIAPPEAPIDQFHSVTACARTGSATAFALTILLVGWFSGANFGPRTGLFASLAMTLMPRLWGHAHLASLETITNLTCTAAVLAVAHWWNQSTPPTWRAGLFAGLLLGLAFLTKIQAVLLPLPIIVWTIWRWRLKAAMPLLLWGLTGAMVFFAGWPWLWLDPVEHLREYFGRTTDRAALSVWYFGTHYTDKAVPWHYPWVIFFTTVPMPTVLLGLRFSAMTAWRSLRSGNDASDSAAIWLILANVLCPLVVFSLPGVAVYDCERLFLTALPFWAILAARGADFFLEQPSFPRFRWAALTVVLLVQLTNLVSMSPCHLSFYNFFVQGTAGAERIGLETTYWGDSVTRSLLEEMTRKVPPGETISVAPVLHQFQLESLVQQSPILRKRRHTLQPYEGRRDSASYLLIFRRRADLADDLQSGPASAELLAETRRGNAQLAALYQLKSVTPP